MGPAVHILLSTIIKGLAVSYNSGVDAMQTAAIGTWCSCLSECLIASRHGLPHVHSLV